MILIDLQQVMIANLMQSIKHLKSNDIDENLIRHMVLNTLRSYIRQYKTKYGKQVVICCDSKHYWRKDIFPFYKAHRKKDREKSPLDWALIFDSLSKIRDELKENFPYKVMDVYGAEADDIIAVLTRQTRNEDILIVSSDRDFVQLQKYGNVSQLSPREGKYITVEDPLLYIKEHILRGDSGDGIPNFLSPDNTFVIGERQKSISKDKLAKWIHIPADQICLNDTQVRNYSRNEQLVNFDFIPDDLTSKIIEEWNVPKKGNKQKMLNYFMDKSLKELTLVLDEF